MVRSVMPVKNKSQIRNDDLYTFILKYNTKVREVDMLVL